MHPLCAKATACGRELLELEIRFAYARHKISVSAVAACGHRVENSSERVHAPDGHVPLRCRPRAATRVFGDPSGA